MRAQSTNSSLDFQQKSNDGESLEAVGKCKRCGKRIDLCDCTTGSSEE